MLGFRRFVYGAQWAALFLIPIVTVAQSSGWEAITAAGAAVLGFIALLINAIVSTRAKDLRASRAVPPTYAFLTVAFWVVALIFPLSLQHSGDTDTSPSALQGLGLSLAANSAVTQLATALSIVLWIAALLALLLRVHIEVPSEPATTEEPAADSKPAAQ